MALSNYLETAIINATLRGISLSIPTTVYLALFTSDPTDSGTGTQVSGGGYVRRAITFSAPSDGLTSNSSDILFPVASASWGTITHIGIYDHLTSGNLLYHGRLTSSKVIQTNDQLKVGAGDIAVTLT